MKRKKEWVRVWKEIYATLGEEKIAELVPTYLKAQNEWYARRVREIGERYGDCVDSWDVVNESAKDYDILTVKAHEGKVSFRGFRGRYRLKWIDADGNNQSKTVELK